MLIEYTGVVRIILLDVGETRHRRSWCVASSLPFFSGFCVCFIRAVPRRFLHVFSLWCVFLFRCLSSLFGFPGCPMGMLPFLLMFVLSCVLAVVIFSLSFRCWQHFFRNCLAFRCVCFGFFFSCSCLCPGEFFRIIIVPTWVWVRSGQ